MKKLLISLALLALAACARPAFADEGKCFSFPVIVRVFLDHGDKVGVIQPADLADFIAKVDALTGLKHEGITRAFIAAKDGVLLAGLEKDGCLLKPIILNSIDKRTKA